MMKMKRVGAPVPSPDGKWVVFDAMDVDLEANTKISHLWIVPAAGGEAHRLNQTPNPEERPRFSPDGKRLIWTSKATDPTQIWMCNFTAESGGLDGQPHQVTNISTGADGGIWSPDGKSVVFLSSVYPDANDDAENKRRDEELGKSKMKAKIFTKLLYRHWTSYTEFKRSHLFVVSADSSVEAGVSPAPASGSQPARLPLQDARDLTPGDHDVPPFNLGGQDMYAVSPDGQELAYTSNIDEVEATSTNNEIFLVPMAGGTPKKISTSPGNDNTPVYSPDENHLAWKSMARAGFEADKESLIIYQRKLGQSRNATINFDRSVGSLAWTPDSKAIFFSAEDHGESPIWSLPLDGKAPRQVARLHADDLAFSNDGNTLFFSRVSIDAPSEIARLDLASKKGGANLPPLAVTRMNEALLAQIDAADGVIHVSGREQRAGRRLPCSAARIRRDEKISAEVFDPWRAAGFLGKFVVVSLERRIVRGERLRRGHDQFPWLDRLRAEVHRLDQRRLGREAVRGFDEGARSRREDLSVHRQIARGGARRELRRLHGELGPRPHRSLQMHRVARRRL
jgi:Tol biopolymer transport system component